MKLVLTIDGMPIDALALDATRFRDEAYIQELKQSLEETYRDQIDAKKESYAIFLEGVPSQMNQKRDR